MERLKSNPSSDLLMSSSHSQKPLAQLRSHRDINSDTTESTALVLMENSSTLVSSPQLSSGSVGASTKPEPTELSEDHTDLPTLHSLSSELEPTYQLNLTPLRSDMVPTFHSLTSPSPSSHSLTRPRSATLETSTSPQVPSSLRSPLLSSSASGISPLLAEPCATRFTDQTSNTSPRLFGTDTRTLSLATTALISKPNVNPYFILILLIKMPTCSILLIFYVTSLPTVYRHYYYCHTMVATAISLHQEPIKWHK